MPTSGTIGTTVISTDKVIEHALRRCGLNPASQTNETIQVALDNLYLLILALLNEGVNLWLIQHSFVGLEQYKATYRLPVGTVDLLNVQYSTPSLATGTETNNALSHTVEFTENKTVEMIGVNFSLISASNQIFLEHSSDGLIWTEITNETKTDWDTGITYWFNVDPLVSDLRFRVRSATNITVSSFKIATSVYDLPIYAFNRDDYLAQSNKSVSGRPSTNYYFEKKLAPQITLWPIPNNGDDFLSVATQRQIQDVGTLRQEIEVPERWKEYIIWQLAKRLAYELPEVQPERAGLIGIEVNNSMIQVGIGETDGTSTRIALAIGGYTR